MEKKIKPYRCLPSKPPGPKFQCCTKLHIYPLREGLIFLSTGHKRAAQRQHSNLGLQGRQRYSKGLICPFTVGILYIICIYIYTYIYQHMPRGAVMAPLREGMSKWCPFISKVFLNLFWVIINLGYIVHLCYLKPRKQCPGVFPWLPKNGACQTCHLRVGGMCRGCRNATPLG